MWRAFVTSLVLVCPAAVLAQAEPPIAIDDPAGQEAPRPEDSSRMSATTLRVSTVKEVLASQRDDEHVVLRGRIVKHIRGEDYMFSDGTGEIEVEIDDDDYPKDRLQMNTDVEIRGEVDLERDGRVTIDVDRITTAPNRMR